tara:strand:+ start:844 stop:1557 length:714 start_codon:yes stop_codon:yes gene_type:complete
VKNILAKGGVEFLAVFLGIALSLWVDEYQKTKESKKLSNQILNRLYKNLEADSTDGLWNKKAHDLVMDSGDFILNWCNTNNGLNDSIEIHLSRLAIATTLVNIEEEYNALKSSGRMELFEDENLVAALHDYYSWINYIKIMQTNIRSIIVDQYLPFMSNYSEYFGLNKDKNIYDNTYPAFELHSVPPKKKISHYASHLGTYGFYASSVYKTFMDKVVYLRKLIRQNNKTSASFSETI